MSLISVENEIADIYSKLGVSPGGPPASSLPFSVIAFGAKGDLKVITDAFMTAGFAQLSSGQVTFVGTDVGKSVVVQAAGPNDPLSGGGGPPTPLITTIQSVAAGVATLAASATNGVTNGVARFSTDDTLAVQDATNAAIAAYKTLGTPVEVVFDPGRAYGVGPVFFNNGVRYRATGASVYAIQNNWTSKGLFRAADANGVSLPNGTVLKDIGWIGGKLVGTGAELQNTNMYAYRPGGGIGTQNCILWGVEMTGFGTAPVQIYNPTNLLAAFSYFHDNEFHETGFNNTLDIVVDGLAPFSGTYLSIANRFHNSVAQAVTMVINTQNNRSFYDGGPVNYLAIANIITANPPIVRTGVSTFNDATTTTAATSMNQVPRSLPVVSTAGFPTVGYLTVAGVPNPVQYNGVDATHFLNCIQTQGGSNTCTNGGAVTDTVFVADPGAVANDFYKYVTGGNMPKLAQIFGVIPGVGYGLSNPNNNVAAGGIPQAASGLTVYVGVYRSSISFEVDPPVPTTPPSHFSYIGNRSIGYERVVMGANGLVQHGLMEANTIINAQVNAGPQWSSQNPQGSAVGFSSDASDVSLINNNITSVSAPLVPDVQRYSTITGRKSGNRFSTDAISGTGTLNGTTGVWVPTLEVRNSNPGITDSPSLRRTSAGVAPGFLIPSTLVSGTLLVTVANGAGTVVGSVTLAAGSIAVPATGAVLSIAGPGIAVGTTLTIDSSTTGHLSLASTSAETAVAEAVGGFLVVSTSATDNGNFRWDLDH